MAITPVKFDIKTKAKFHETWLISLPAHEEVGFTVNIFTHQTDTREKQKNIFFKRQPHI